MGPGVHARIAVAIHLLGQILTQGHVPVETLCGIGGDQDPPRSEAVQYIQLRFHGMPSGQRPPVRHCGTDPRPLVDDLKIAFEEFTELLKEPIPGMIRGLRALVLTGIGGPDKLVITPQRDDKNTGFNDAGFR